MPRDLTFGRIALPTLFDDVKEALGGSLEAAGAALVPAEPKPQPLGLTLPVHGDQSDADGYEIGVRMRRQLRSLLSNPPALAPIYLKWAVDPELNGWLLVGGGEIEYAAGGITFADFKVPLSDCYLVGTPWSHRPARRLELHDRRLQTVPRDMLGTVYSTDFAAAGALALVFLPHGASDVLGTGRAIVTPLERDGLGSSVPFVVGAVDGDVYSFEQGEADQGLGDVVIYDRRGELGPFGGGVYDTAPGLLDPQAAYGWEELYGPKYPLSSGDVPVLQNGLCRLRYLVQSGTPTLVIETVVAGAWVEQGRVFCKRDQPAGTTAAFDTLLSAAVAEWTPERAVLRVRLRRVGTDSYCDLYITLQRGWLGPRFELYTSWGGSGALGAMLVYSPADSGTQFFAGGGGGGFTTVARASDDAGGWPLTAALLTADDIPWAVLASSGRPVAQFAFLRAGQKLILQTSSLGHGSSRSCLALAAEYGTAGAGYAELRLGYGAEAVADHEAESYRNTGSGTTSSVADAAAYGGNAVEDTQTARTARTTNPTATQLGLGLGKYQMLARVWAVLAGATGSFAADTTMTSLAAVTRTSPFVNLVTNPSFEADTVNWTLADTNASVTWTRSTEQAFSGSYSSKLVNTEASSGDYIFTDVAGLTPGATYTISAWARVTAFTAGATGDRGLLALSLGVAGFVNTQITAVTSGWVRHTVVWTAGSDGKINVRLYAPQATVYWDAVQVVAGSSDIDYQWLSLGEVVVAAGSDVIGMAAWRSAGSGPVRVDRVRLVPSEQRTEADAQYDGVRDLGASNLYDLRPVPTLVAR
jgi:hypothetical protein